MFSFLFFIFIRVEGRWRREGGGSVVLVFFLVDFWRFARQDLVNFWQVLDVVIYFEKNNLK